MSEERYWTVVGDHHARMDYPGLEDAYRKYKEYAEKSEVVFHHGDFVDWKQEYPTEPETKEVKMPAETYQDELGYTWHIEDEFSGYMWLSFVGDEKFLGVAIVEADALEVAIENSWLGEYNPGGEVLGIPIPASKFTDEMQDNAHQLLTKKAAEALAGELVDLQEQSTKVCPRCSTGAYTPYWMEWEEGLPARPALSRSDNQTYVCSDCGNEEAIMQMDGADISQETWMTEVTK